jgi:hypothetical protein
MLLTAALSMAVLLGFTAMAIDVGMAYQDRRDLQNDADAAALAGSQHLPADPDQAIDTATDWLALNDIEPGQITDIEVSSTYVANDTIRVEVDDDFGWVFARALGMTSSNIGAHSKAVVGTLQGTGHLMPWSIVYGDSDCLDSNNNAIFSQVCSVKMGAQGKYGGGWRGALDFDGNGGGASEYRDNIIDGEADTMYCIEGQDDPPCESSIIDIKNGNVVGPTEQGIEGRLAQGPQCDANSNGKDDFTEVFAPTGMSSPAYSVSCPDSPWLLLIPIVEYDGGQTVTIRGWALSYFETYYCAGSSIAPVGNGTYVYAYDDVKAVSAVAPACNTASDAPFVSGMPPVIVDDEAPTYVSDPHAGPLPAPAACHNGNPHGQQQCTPSPTPSPTPSQSATPTPASTGTPTPTPAGTATASPTPSPTSGTPTPTPAPGGNCNGQGHWEVRARIVDASYSQSAGFLGAYDPEGGVTLRKLVE